MDPYLFKRLWRRPWLSLCGLVLSLTLCILLGYLSGHQQELKLQLEETRTSYDILCVVTDRRGGSSSGLKLGPEILDFVFDEGEEGLYQFVRDLRITKEFDYTCPKLGLFNQEDLTLAGVNSERCDPLLDPELGAQVTYLTEDFYTQDGFLCLIPERLTAELEGDKLILNIEDPYISPNIRKYVGTGQVELTVAGTYRGESNRIFISFDAAQRIAEEISKKHSFDAMSFLAADNERLDELYSVAKRYFSKVDPNAGNKLAHKPALTVYDEQYRATIAALEQNIERTGYLLPVVLLLGLGVGFLISFLFTRSERRTYALMRTLGMTRGRLFGSILREQLLLVVIAVAAAVAMTGEIMQGAVYFLCYAVGCAACIFKAIRVPPTAILRGQE